MEPDVLSPAQHQLLRIVQTLHTDYRTLCFRVIELVYAQPEAERLDVMRPLLRWLGGTIIDPAVAEDESAAPIGEAEFSQAAELIDSMTTAGSLMPVPKFALGTTIDTAAQAVLTQLDALAEHGRVVQVLWLLDLTIEHPDIPFISDLSFDIGQVLEISDLAKVLLERPSLVSEVEALLNHPDTSLKMIAAWLTQLHQRTADRSWSVPPLGTCSTGCT